MIMMMITIKLMMLIMIFTEGPKADPTGQKLKVFYMIDDDDDDEADWWRDPMDDEDNVGNIWETLGSIANLHKTIFVRFNACIMCIHYIAQSIFMHSTIGSTIW